MRRNREPASPLPTLAPARRPEVVTPWGQPSVPGSKISTLQGVSSNPACQGRCEHTYHG
jgi:hypothetical protein